MHARSCASSCRRTRESEPDAYCSTGQHQHHGARGAGSLCPDCPAAEPCAERGADQRGRRRRHGVLGTGRTSGDRCHHGGLCPELRPGHGTQVRHGHAGRDGGATGRTEFPLCQGHRQHRFRRADSTSGNDRDLHRAAYRLARQSGHADTVDGIKSQHLAFDRLVAWPPAGGLRQHRRNRCAVLVDLGHGREPGTRAATRSLAVHRRQRRRRHDCAERILHRTWFDDRRLGWRGQCRGNGTRRHRYSAALRHVRAARSGLRHCHAGRCR